MERTFAAGVLATALAGLAWLGPNEAQAQDWPSKPVRIVTGFAAGGIGDLGARLLADHITRTTGQQAVVENRTGAAGSLGMDAVAKAAPVLGIIDAEAAVALIDMSAVEFGKDGKADQKSVETALKDLVKRKTFLVRHGSADGGAGDLYRIEDRRGSQGPRASHGDLDLADNRGRLLGGELVGHGPARVVGGGAQAALPLEGIHLDHHAVGVVAETRPVPLHLGADVDHRLDIGAAP